MELTSPLGWARESFGGAKLGDKRRTNRLVEFAGALAGKTGESIPTAFRFNAAAAEGAYRFARNEAVDPADIAAAGFEATVRRIKKLKPKVLLAPEDSTVLSYTHDVDDLGDVGGPAAATTRGIWAHSAIVVDPQTGLTLGLVAQHRWIRDPKKYGKKHQRREIPYVEKESFKWQRTAQEMRKRLGPQLMKRIIAVCDREGDVFAYLAHKQKHGERYLVRAEWNRNVTEQQEQHHLHEVLRSAEVFGTARIEVPQRGGRPAREATLVLKRATVELKRPKPLGAEYVSKLTVNAVLAEELNPPNEEEPLSWMLLTTEPIGTLGQVKTVLKFYRLRWRIEVFHKAWKTGAGVERQRMQTAKNLERVATVLAFIAIRLLQLRELFETAPKAGCEQILDKDTWQLLWVTVEQKKPPRVPPKIKWAYQAIARLAGWTDSKATGKVGWDTLWKGWSQLQLLYEGLQAYKRLKRLR